MCGMSFFSGMIFTPPLWFYSLFSFQKCLPTYIAPPPPSTSLTRMAHFYQGWTVLTHRCHPKSIGYLKLTLAVVYFMDKCIMTHHHYSTKQYFHRSKYPLCSVPPHPILPTTPEHWSFILLSTVLLFLDCLLSFSNIHLRFLHVFSCLNGSLLFSSK